MSENKKYSISEIGKTMGDGSKVYQIESLIDIPNLNVTVGDAGGFIESEGNLSFEEGDLSWVRGGSVVYGDSEVKNNSVISRRSEIKNSVIDDSIVHKDSKVNDSEISHSLISHGTIVSDSKVSDSEITYSDISHGTIINDSKVFNSQMARDIVNGSNIELSNTHESTITKSTLVGVEGAGKVIDSYIEDSVISELEHEEYVGYNMVSNEVKSVGSHSDIELSDADLVDLNDLEDGLKI